MPRPDRAQVTQAGVEGRRHAGAIHPRGEDRMARLGDRAAQHLRLRGPPEGEHVRGQCAQRIPPGARPQTEDEVAWADRATVQMIADEPW